MRILSILIKSDLKLCSPVRTPGFKSRIRPPYPQCVVKACSETAAQSPLLANSEYRKERHSALLGVCRKRRLKGRRYIAIVADTA